MFEPPLWLAGLSGAVMGVGAAGLLLWRLEALWPAEGVLARRWVVVPASALVVVAVAVLFAWVLVEGNRVTYQLPGPEVLSR